MSEQLKMFDSKKRVGSNTLEFLQNDGMRPGSIASSGPHPEQQDAAEMTWPEFRDKYTRQSMSAIEAASVYNTWLKYSGGSCGQWSMADYLARRKL